MIGTRTALFVGAAAVGATLGVVGIAQATSPSSSSSAKSAAPAQAATPSLPAHGDEHGHHGKRPDEARGLGRLGGLGGLGGLSETLHGEFTVAQGTQAPKTVDVQRGAVLTVAAQTVTVRSTDGFVSVYTMNRDTRVSKDETSAGTSTLAAGQTVRVLANRSGDTRTALRIRIRTR